MLTAEEACGIGLVDEVAPLEKVVEHAEARCRRLLSLPSRAMRETRALGRRELVQMVERGEQSFRDIVDLWFSDETQAALQALVRRLKNG
jgi:enoyl-CoA hydratase/carnithine racemase